jgi:uncharacterized membrane protein (UPF0127 family)
VKRRLLTASIAAALALCGCGDDSSSNTARASAPFERFEASTATLDGRQLAVLLADNDQLRAKGLGGVDGVGAYDGMIFVFPGDTNEAFWMYDTRFALDIAFVAADGAVLEQATMTPCATAADACPRTTPAHPYRTALEAPAGAFARWNLQVGSRLISNPKPA